MDWMKRRNRREDSLAVYFRRYDRTKTYLIIEIHSKLGMGNRVIACQRTPQGERLISRHRTANGAQRAIEKLNRRLAR